MSQPYKIEAVGEPREWSNDYGAFFAYPLTLEGVAGPKEWSRKTSSRVPSVGEQIVGEIQGDKIKVDLDATKELSGGGSGGGGSRPASKSKEWKPESAYDPEKVARIGRAHAQGMALRLLAINEPAPSTSKQVTAADVFALADQFEADVNKAAQKAAQGAGPTASQGASPGGSAPAPAQVPDDTHQRIESLLEESGINRSAARLMADYAVGHMTEAEQSAVVERLQNVNMRPAAITRLTERTEGHHGEPLPTAASGAGGPDDDIPFARPEYREPFGERERKSNRP